MASAKGTLPRCPMRIDYLMELFRYLPLQAMAGAHSTARVDKLATLQSVHKKHQLREKVIALNAFVASMKEVSGASDP